MAVSPDNLVAALRALIHEAKYGNADLIACDYSAIDGIEAL
jgi:hypothetical protein